MTQNRYNAKRDANEPEIVKAFESMGCSVHQLNGAGIPDLLVGFGWLVMAVEVKTKKGKLTPQQEKFKREFNGPYMVVRTIEDVWHLVEDMRKIQAKVKL